MATVTETQHSPEDLLSINDRPMPELVDGKLVEREMGQQSDAIALLIGSFLVNFVRANRLGLVNGSQGSYQIFPVDPKKVRIPDVSFTSFARLEDGKPAIGHARIAPDLVVEVISPNDTADNMIERIDDFLKAGVALIWIIDPKTQTVFVQRRDGSARRLQLGDTIDGENVIPGFACRVADLFD